MKYFVVVNFVSLPYEAFLEKRKWYGYVRGGKDICHWQCGI